MASSALKCLEGKDTEHVTTGGGSAYPAALRDVLPGARYQVCLQHRVRNKRKKDPQLKIRFKEFAETFGKQLLAPFKAQQASERAAFLAGLEEQEKRGRRRGAKWEREKAREVKRFEQRQVVEFIVARARAMLQLAIDYIQSLDRIAVIYGDVDSVMLSFPPAWSAQRCVSEGEKIAEAITRAIGRKLRAEGFPEERASLLRLKLEAFYVTYLLVDVKKRYSGVRVWKDGKGFTPSELHSVGHEFNRTDRCPFVRNLQETLFNMIHDLIPIDEILKYLRYVKADLYAGKYDEDLVLTVRLVKPLFQYKKAFAPARAARILRRMGRYLPHKKIKYVYLSHTLVWPVAHGVPKKPITKEGYDHIWENRTMTWLPKVLQPFISPAQLQMEIEGIRSLDHFFSPIKPTEILKTTIHT